VVAGDDVEHVSITDDVGQRRDRPRMAATIASSLRTAGSPGPAEVVAVTRSMKSPKQHDLRSHAAGIGEARHQVRERLVLDEGVGIRTGPGRHVEIRPTG
jgi:hypothetical protein